MCILACEGVTRRPFFEGFDLTADAGEIVVLQGPTGSGKTLFLRAVGDLDPADEGRFLLDGTERGATSPTKWRSSVLYVHQSAPRLEGTVGENLARIRGLHATKTCAVPIALPALDPEKDAARLSGGEAQLLALHRALAVGPQVLLLDESTSALDAERARQVEAVLVDWAAAGHAIVWVSHEDSLASRVGARRERFP